jgi:hypothetical protein
MFIPASGQFIPDPAFGYFEKAHNVTETMLSLMYPNFTSTTNSVFPAYNFTAFTLSPYNVTVAYTHIKDANPSPLAFPFQLPGHSNALIIYTNSTKSTDPISKYLLTVSNPAYQGNVSWDIIKTLPSGANFTVSYTGLDGLSSSESFNIDFDGVSTGSIAQKITINLTAPQPWPVISVSTAQSGPFAGMGQIMIEPLGHNLTVSLVMIPTTPLSGSVSAWSYDSFYFAFPALKIAKNGRYRIV